MSLPEKPLTRREVYLAKAAGQDVTLPEEDITREEMYLRAIAEGGGGGGTSPFYPAGNIEFANLPELSADILGAMYNITDAFTTDSRFNEGAGVKYPAGTNVAVVNVGTAESPVLKYDTFAGAYVVDNALSDASENPVQNKVIKSALDGKATPADIAALIDDTTAAQNKAYSSAKVEEKVAGEEITTTATGSDLTLSTSEGNINALTVYGKSEVVDGSITSAGEGWATVDLGTLNWNYSAEYASFSTRITDMATGTYSIAGNILCAKYQTKSQAVLDTESTGIAVANNANVVIIKDPAYTDTTAFKNSLNGVLLCYQLADPTQGNAIAVKTDNGSGIDGTMAVFETGTPLYGVSDTVRDVMEWDGSAGTVTKVCAVENLGTRNWNVAGEADHTFYIGLYGVNQQSDVVITNLTDYTQVYSIDELAATDKSFLRRIDTTITLFRNTAYSEAADFKTSMTGKKIIYELATPTTQTLTATENASLAGLRTFTPTTHVQNNTGADMTVTAYAGTANGQAVQELENRIKSEIDEVKNEKSHFCYSYKIDMNNSDPATCVKPHFDTRYGCDNFNFTSAHMDYANDRFEYGSWEGFIRRIARPCMLKFDGTVDYYLDPDDYSKKITGEASDVADVNYQGNAMVELEKLYFKRYTHNGIQYCFISDRKLDNSFKCYAHHDKYGKELDYIYRACYDGMYDGTRLRSISGIDYHNLNALTAGYIMSNATRQEEMNFAKANNVSTEQGEGWNILHKSEWDYINDILVLIGMSTDTQGTFGRGRDGGYVSATNTGIISTGTMDTKGLFWGKNDSTAGVKVLGFENPWANIWKSCAGWMLISNQHYTKMTFGTEDGSTGTGFNTGGTGYLATGASISANGYISDWAENDNGFLPTAASGSASTYRCDYVWQNTTTYFALVGGGSNVGLQCGAFYADLDYGAGGRSWGIGAALSYKGLAA